MSDDNKSVGGPNIHPPKPEVQEGTRRDWSVVQDDPGKSTTDRLRVRDGWLYRTVVGGQVAMVYVPGEE